LRLCRFLFLASLFSAHGATKIVPGGEREWRARRERASRGEGDLSE